MQIILRKLILVLIAWAATQSLLPAACTDGVQPSGARYRLCVPAPGVIWNKQLVIYAHGYVSPDQPVGIPEDQLYLPDGTYLPDIFVAKGFAFALSGYRANGLVIPEGVEDLRELVEVVLPGRIGKPNATYLGGVSEGGLITALSAEKYPNVYDGAVAACGPVGSFIDEINYLGSVRVLFDYFFPGVLPGTVVKVPPELTANWTTVYSAAARRALTANPSKAQEFLNTSGVPAGPDFASTVDNALAALRYSAVAYPDAAGRLHGQPFTNQSRFYLGSSNDWELNIKVPRYTADAIAVDNMKRQYETSGKPKIPLVTLHTAADSSVPWLQELTYYLKVAQTGYINNVIQIPVFRNGHCNFDANDVALGFALMLIKVGSQSSKDFTSALPPAERARFGLVQ